jgi:hypothetical protein
MALCPKCGKEVASPDNLCDTCLAEMVAEAARAPLISNPAGPGGADQLPPLTATVAQRALAGAKKGAVLGAIYGAIWGLVAAALVLAFPIQDKVEKAGVLLVTWTCVGAAILTPLGALWRIAFPGKATKNPKPGPDPAKRDTKIDHP